jgi:hypothetical protein
MVSIAPFSFPVRRFPSLAQRMGAVEADFRPALLQSEPVN